MQMELDVRTEIWVSVLDGWVVGWENLALIGLNWNKMAMYERRISTLGH